MWKVLLVEDELFVRRKLLKLVNWEDYGFLVSGEASHGEEALQLMQHTKPDLVITDILMPRMDGLELLRQSRLAGIDSRFVMLTCMGEFEYARQALDLGASGYLLKLSLSIPELESVLSKIGKELAAVSGQQRALLVGEFRRYYPLIWQAVKAEQERVREREREQVEETRGSQQLRVEDTRSSQQLRAEESWGNRQLPSEGTRGIQRLRSEETGSNQPLRESQQVHQGQQLQQLHQPQPSPPSPQAPGNYRVVFMVSCIGWNLPLKDMLMAASPPGLWPEDVWVDTYVADGLTTCFFWSGGGLPAAVELVAALPTGAVAGGPVPAGQATSEWSRMYRRLQDNWYATGLPGGDGSAERGLASSGIAGREEKGERAKSGDAGSNGRISNVTGGARDSTISGGVRGSDVIGGSGGRTPGGDGARSGAPLWLLEKDLTSAFAERRRTDLIRLAEGIWARHLASRTPFLQVMEMAERLLRTFTEISKHALGSLSTDAQAAVVQPITQAATLPSMVEAPGTHQQLLAQFLADAGEQMKRMAEAEGMVTDHPEINRVLTYIHAHYAENISLKALARHVAMEEHYLSRLFRQKTHETLINYLQQIRVKKAQQLLSETDLTVTDIGCRVGFPSDNYFIKTFKKWSGDTPGAYRRKREKEAE